MNDFSKEIRAILAGISAGVLSTVLLIGSLMLSVGENNNPLAAIPTRPAASVTSPVEIDETGEPAPSATPGATETQASSPTPNLASCPPPAGWSSINVQPGDTISSLAVQYLISPEELAAANCLPVETGSLAAGSVLSVPPPRTATATLQATSPGGGGSPASPSSTACIPGKSDWVRYTIQPGDNLFQISLRFNTTMKNLRLYNCLINDDLFAGDTLWVPNVPTRTPTLTPTSASTPTPTHSPEPPTPVTPSSTPVTPSATPVTPTDTPFTPSPWPETPTPPPDE